MALIKDFQGSLHLISLYVGIALAICVVSKIIYLRYFHPLAHVPGPFLASVTELYRFYYDYIKNGSFYLQFEGYRAKYGPVIRIAPNEVLLTDPDNYEKVYSMNTKFYKDPSFYELSGANTALFAIISNEDHRRYRAVLNPFFSRRSVLEQEEIVQSKVAKLLARIEADSTRKVPTDISVGFRAISVDVITEYAFGADRCWHQLDREDLGVWYNNLARTVVPMMYVFKIIPSLQAPMQAMPYWLAKLLNPIVTGMMDMMELMKKEIEKVVREVNSGVKPPRETIFHTVLNPNAGAAEDYKTPTVKHMVDEAFGMLGAAAETAGNAMAMSAFHVVFNPEIYAKLRKELVEAFPDPTKPIDFLTLEKLPYLTGVIKEGLRLSYGVLHPLPRVVPEGGEIFNGYILPKGTVVCMTSWLMHRDPSAFPDAEKFDPERWLDVKKSQFQEKFLVPFSRGSRMCIGQPLSMCELYVSIGQLFRKFGDLEPIDVGPEDMVYEDYFGPFHPKDARKFRILRTGSE